MGRPDREGRRPEGGPQEEGQIPIGRLEQCQKAVWDFLKPQIEFPGDFFQTDISSIFHPLSRSAGVKK